MLTKCLKDEAAEATRSIAFSQANYKLILEILKNRFGSDSQAIDQRKHLLRESAAAEVPEDYSSKQLTINYNQIQNQILSLRTVRRFYGRVKGAYLRNNIRQFKDKTSLLYYHRRSSREELLSRLTDYSVSLVALYMVHGFHN